MGKIRTSVKFSGIDLEREMIVSRWKWADIIFVVRTIRTIRTIKIKDIGPIIRFPHDGVSTSPVGRGAIGLVREVGRQTAPLHAAEDLKPEGFSIHLEEESTEPFDGDRAATCVGQLNLTSSAVTMQFPFDAPPKVHWKISQASKIRFVLKSKRRVVTVAEEAVLESPIALDDGP